MIFDFAPYSLDDETCELHCDGELVPLQPRVLEVLLYLVRERHRVVPKNELLDELWKGVAVGDAVLTRAINHARQALGDAGSAQHRIKTVPRKGYRFYAEVQVRDSARAPSDARFADAARAFAARDWQGTLAAFDAVEAANADSGQGPGELGPGEWEMRAWAHEWTADYGPALGAFERAFQGYETAGDARSAARIALHLVRVHSFNDERAEVTAWSRRAIAALADLDECEEHALLEWTLGRGLWLRGEYDAAIAKADACIAIARRVGSLDLEALGLLDRGHGMLCAGRMDEAVELHDEAAAIALSGRLGVEATGTIFCSVIWGCRNRGDWSRASDWTDRSIQWCETSNVARFPGLCTLHRAEVLRLQGDFAEAEVECVRACDDLLIGNVSIAGHAFNELGEIRLRRGDLPGARGAFRRAIELGRLPEPGLSRLRLEDGDPKGAIKGIDRALADPDLEAKERTVLLHCGRIEAGVAAGDLEIADASLAALDAEPARWASDAQQAEVGACRARVLQARGELERALSLARASRRTWLAVGAVYEAARVQVLIAGLLEAEGDASGAEIEWEAARDAFERVGAQLDAQRASSRLAQLCSTTASSPASDALRTFVFTDIVGSTALVEALGDSDWEMLRRWHHRTLRTAFIEHGGEIVGPHEGDGFFVAFGDADAAVECAIAIQRTLAAHREQHGFAPRVRIGAHTAESVRRGGDYSGIGVNVAARVAGAAAGGEIHVTAATVEHCSQPHAFGATQAAALAGVSEPVDVCGVEWN